MLTFIPGCNNPPIIYSEYAYICSTAWLLGAGLTHSGIGRLLLSFKTFEG
ncbi:hypothetical protein [Clostridium sp. BNL1100]|nr:hypothetical protein [Clostridium sp. BNL1100]